MSTKLMAPLLGSLLVFIPFPASAQSPASKSSVGQAPAPGLRKLTGEDEKKAKQLDEQIDKATKADRWDEAIARAEEMLALRARAQGPKHFETVDAEWNLKTLRRVAVMSKEDQGAYRSAGIMGEQARTLYSQGKHTQAQQLIEKVLEIKRRLFGDEHPETLKSQSDLAADLLAQGKYAEAQRLLEKVLQLDERLLGTEHPTTGADCNNVAWALRPRGNTRRAQPLFEKALEIYRRLLTDEDPVTAAIYNNLAENLRGQGKYGQAQPLYEMAMAIRRRLLTDDHIDTADSYNNLAVNLDEQGKHAQAQPLAQARWRSTAGCSVMTTPPPPATTTTWRTT